MLKIKRYGETPYLQDHNALKNLNLENQHPIKAITGLEDALKGKKAIGDIEGLEDALNSKFEVPDSGIPLSLLDGEIVSKEFFDEFNNSYEDTIKKLEIKKLSIDKTVNALRDDVERADSELELHLKELELSVNTVYENSLNDTNDVAAVKSEIMKLKEGFDRLISDVLSQLQSNHKVISSVDRLKHMILDLNLDIDKEYRGLRKNREDIQKLASAQKEIKDSLKNGKLYDEVLYAIRGKIIESNIGRAKIEQVSKQNANPGDFLDIYIHDNNLQILEPTVLKLSDRVSSGVDMISQFDYNNVEDFECSMSVNVSNGLSLKDLISLKCDFKSDIGDYSKYCLDSSILKEFKDIISISTDNGLISLEMDNGACITYTNEGVEILYKDLTYSIESFDNLKRYTRSKVDFNFITNSRINDFKVAQIKNGAFNEYTVPANLVDFGYGIQVRSESDCLQSNGAR